MFPELTQTHPTLGTMKDVWDFWKLSRAAYFFVWHILKQLFPQRWWIFTVKTVLSKRLAENLTAIAEIKNLIMNK